MRDLIDSALAEVRLEAGLHRRAGVSLRGFVSEIAVTAQMHADSRSIELVVDAVDPGKGCVFTIDVPVRSAVGSGAG